MNKRNPSRAELGRLVREFNIPFSAMRRRIFVIGVLYIIYVVLFFSESPLAYQSVNVLYIFAAILVFVLVVLYVMYRGDSVRVYEHGIESCFTLINPKRFLWQNVVGYKFAVNNGYVYLIEQATKREFKLHPSIFTSNTFINEVESLTSHKWVKVGL